MAGRGQWWAPKLSRVRTLLFGALAFVWLTEMVLWGVFSRTWTYFWNMIPPADPQLATQRYLTHAVQAPAKAALGVLAVFGLLSNLSRPRLANHPRVSALPPRGSCSPRRSTT